jgi:hypothetical protein
MSLPECPIRTLTSSVSTEIARSLNQFVAAMRELCLTDDRDQGNADLVIEPIGSCASNL